MTYRISNLPRAHGLDDFCTFLQRECRHPFPKGSSLADYIEFWLAGPYGRGAASCFGDFEIFLKTIPLIVDAWYRDPTILHYYGSGSPPYDAPLKHRATSAFGDDDKQHAIFDRDNFTAAVFIWQRSQSR